MSIIRIACTLAMLQCASVTMLQSQTSDEGLVKQAETDWNEAIRKQDARAVRQFMADDYVLVGVRSTGSNTVERDAWLQSLAAMRIVSYQAEVTRVRVYGDSAVVSVKGGWHISFSGREIDENFFLTDVWSRQPQGWKVVLRHSSPYPR
jgi:ketosteroid isomerase-like protein